MQETRVKDAESIHSDNFQRAQYPTHQLLSLLNRGVEGNQSKEMIRFLMRGIFQVNGQTTNGNECLQSQENASQFAPGGKKMLPRTFIQPDLGGASGDTLVNCCSAPCSCISAPSTAHHQFNKYFVPTKVFLLNELITAE